MRENRKSPRRNGFSLVELMIVISIIGILVAIGIPAWQASVRSANEAAAITHLQGPKTAQDTTFNTHNRATYDTNDQLDAGDYLEKRLTDDAPHVDATTYNITLATQYANSR